MCIVCTFVIVVTFAFVAFLPASEREKIAKQALEEI